MSNNRELADLISQAGGTSEGVLAGRRNLLINGAMQVWQRGTSFGNGLTADRWTVYSPSSTDVVSQQPNTLDTKYPYVAQWVTSSTAGTRYFYQKIEDVRTLSNETATLSFWAKVSSGSAVLTSVVGNQNFGSGGSAFVDGQAQNNTVTTTWQRFTHTGTFASINGKTIGASSYIEAAFNTTETNVTFQITGVQLELGSVATPFEHRSYGEELALCQRYYQISSSGSAYSNGSGTAASLECGFITEMRTTPSVTLKDGTSKILNPFTALINITSITFVASTSDTRAVRLDVGASLPANKFYIINPSAFSLDAEL